MAKGQRKSLPGNFRPLLPLIVLLIFSFSGYAQVYQPGLHIAVNDAIAPAQPTPTDSRSQFYDGNNFRYRDYNGTSEVLSYLTATAYRFGHFPIYVHLGGSLSGGVWTGGIAQVYWFKNGTADSNLVRWYTDSIGGTCSGCLLIANNLSDLNSAPAARSNLGLGSMALINTTAGGDLSGFYPSPTVSFFNGQPPGYYLNYNNLTSKPVGLSLTTSGTSGAATYTSGTGILNIPNYATGGGGACLNCNADTVAGLFVDRSANRNGWVLSLDTANNKWVIVPPDTAGGGGGAVSSVSNSNGTLTISPTTGGVVASLALGHANTWTAAQTFNGGLALGSNVTFATDNTYSIGTSSLGANAVWSHGFQSDGALSLGAAASNPITFNSGSGGAKMEMLATGQLQLNTYTTSTSYTGTSLAFLGTDASGNVIQTPTTSIQGSLSNSGSGFRWFVPGSSIRSFVCAGCTLDSTSNTGSLTLTVTAGGSGTVTAFSAGALSPLFTTSVATATTTPALTFSLANAAGNTVFGNLTGTTGAPSYGVPNATNLNTWFGGTIQGQINLTTTGSTGPATLTGTTLNIPQYTGGSGGVDSAVNPGYGLLQTIVSTTKTLNVDSSKIANFYHLWKTAVTQDTLWQMVYGIPQPNGTGVVGTQIDWNYLTTGGAHAQSALLDSFIFTNGTHLLFGTETPQDVAYSSLTPDEVTYPLKWGVIGNFDNYEFETYVQASGIGITYKGNNTNTWQINANGLAPYTIVIDTICATCPVIASFSLTDGQNYYLGNFNGNTTCLYNGTGGWQPYKVPGTTQTFKYYFLSAGGDTVKGYPQATDEIQITNAASYWTIVDCRQYTSSNEAYFNAGLPNMWYMALVKMYPDSARVPYLHNSQAVASGTAGQINLSWAPVTNAAAYQVDRSTSPNFQSSTTIVSTNINTFNDTGLTTGTLYYYRLRGLASGATTSTGHHGGWVRRQATAP